LRAYLRIEVFAFLATLSQHAGLVQMMSITLYPFERILRWRLKLEQPEGSAVRIGSLLYTCRFEALSSMVNNPVGAFLSRATCAAVEGVVRFDAVPDDLATTVIAHRC
jgi:hypothetical protein